MTGIQFTITAGAKSEAQQLARDVVQAVARGEQIVEFIDSTATKLTLSDQERFHIHFDYGLRSLLEEDGEFAHSTGREALKQILSSPEKFVTDRFRKSIFKRLADHASMCLNGCGIMNFDAQTTARAYGAYPHPPEVLLVAA